MDRFFSRTFRHTILVAVVVVAAAMFGQRGLEAFAISVTTNGSGQSTATPVAPTATPSPVLASPTPKAIYKGHTLEEIRANPALLEEVLSEADYIRPIHGEPDPPLPNFGSDTVCPDHVECP